MLCVWVIELSNSNWQSPIILVPKPDGSLRFCIDFREVNQLATFVAYPMLQANVLLHQLGDTSYMSALNLTKGYWQVPL